MKKTISLILALSFLSLSLCSCDLTELIKDGENGKNGLSAYEKAVAEGFVGSETEWLASLCGSDGTPSENVPEIRDGYWYVNGENTGIKASGEETNVEITEDAPLAGKTIVNFGDSIFGMAQSNSISSYLEEITGATVHNIGFGGCRMAKHPSTKTNWDAFSMYRLADSICTGDFSYQTNTIKEEKNKLGSELPAYFELRVKTLMGIDFNEVDIITIGYGTNDYTGEELIDNEARYDCKTFGGAMRYSIELIQKTYPHINIFICTPTYRAWVDKATLKVTEDSNEHKNGKGDSLIDFIEATYDISAEYNLPVIDLYYELGINRSNRTYYFPSNDGTHHNQFGRELIAKLIAKKLF